jgi:predicted DNA-binding ribbon-helix-helix protein
MRAYEQDYAGWVEDTAQALEEGRFSEIDLPALADEVRDLGKGERERLESALRVLVVHLLKAKYQPEKRTRSWDASIRVERKHVVKYLKQSPSLRRELGEFLEDAYDDARIEAATQTGIDIDTFPETCEWTVAEVLEGTS